MAFMGTARGFVEIYFMQVRFSRSHGRMPPQDSITNAAGKAALQCRISKPWHQSGTSLALCLRSTAATPR